MADGNCGMKLRDGAARRTCLVGRAGHHFGMPTSALPALLELPRRKRLAIAERLWLSVAEEDSLPVPAAHKRVLRERLAAYRAGQIKVVSHAELMRRVRRST